MRVFQNPKVVREYTSLRINTSITLILVLVNLWNLVSQISLRLWGFWTTILDFIMTSKTGKLFCIYEWHSAFSKFIESRVNRKFVEFKTWQSYWKCFKRPVKKFRRKILYKVEQNSTSGEVHSHSFELENVRPKMRTPLGTTRNLFSKKF